MKYLATLILLFVALPVFGQASKSNVAPLDASLVFSVTVPNPVQSFPSDYGDHVITGTITNLSDSTIYLQFHRHQLPPRNWTTSICFGTLCLAPTADSARTLFTFGPHVSEPLIVHFNDTSTSFLPVTDTVRMTLIIQKVPGLPTDTIVLHLVQITDPTGSVDPEHSVVNTAPSLSIFPNPSVSGSEIYAQVESPVGGQAKLSVYSLSGAKLREVTLAQSFRSGTNILKFDPAGLSAGAYMLSVSVKGSTEVSKIFQVVR